ncbi:hypothetical protein [Nocardioides humi]|uniref:Glycosyltransferase RgtA/B/C/D-like domain-containing protein n=1 Tax=Nocardioides humi TaxID=449461 RepID=A0ABN2AA71_9ACTN|nr:hypothetical protein [Nocardioides humi]
MVERRTRVSRATYGAALVAFVAWLPFLRTPLESDESGFLLVARQWAPGSSLYGDHWVDRPPLLIWIFRLADRLGPVDLAEIGAIAPGVKLVGATASALAVLLAGVLAAQLATGPSRWTVRIVPMLAAALLSSPLLGMPATNGEVLAAPFILLGVVCLVAGLAGPLRPRAVLLAAGAGAAAACAALVKQNMVDVFVLALVLLPLSAGRVPQLVRRTLAFAAGALAALTIVLAASAARGTSPAALWDAVVVFRFEASAVISASASSATSDRMTVVALAFLASGAAVTLATTGFLAARTAVLHGPRSAPLPVAALAMAAWEVLGVAAGGSYWLHYLTGLVPGVVLLACLVRPHGRRRIVVTACLVGTALACLTAWVLHLADPIEPELATDARAAHYLRTHADPSDGVVVAFGRPDIVAASGLSSPYPHLWSLPVRVRDPDLTELQAVLTGPDPPRWIVVFGDRVDSWGIDGDRAQAYLDEHYAEQASFDNLHVWKRE